MYLVSIGCIIGTDHNFIHTKYQHNTCQNMLVFVGKYCNTYQYMYDVFGMYCGMYLACIMLCIVVCIESAFACITIQYIRNTNTIHTNTDRYILNTHLLVLNTCWYVLNTYHQYIPQYMPQYMPIHCARIGMYCVAIHANLCI